ncbi:hypothetical protein Dda_3937 [Drechslerella dactyloides]|uniref:Uncharacterized protein n=1 Tax=Drechslerella dactyloides TaxID=74499 RepID=A0AAD6IYT9_DREDA|nr:hypothetical protein Dda_3937 [Drechslerella dactyloides]
MSAASSGLLVGTERVCFAGVLRGRVSSRIWYRSSTSLRCTSCQNRSVRDLGKAAWRRRWRDMESVCGCGGSGGGPAAVPPRGSGVAEYAGEAWSSRLELARGVAISIARGRRVERVLHRQQTDAGLVAWARAAAALRGIMAAMGGCGWREGRWIGQLSTAVAVPQFEQAPNNRPGVHVDCSPTPPLPFHVLPSPPPSPLSIASCPLALAVWNSPSIPVLLVISCGLNLGLRFRFHDTTLHAAAAIMFTAKRKIHNLLHHATSRGSSSLSTSSSTAATTTSTGPAAPPSPAATSSSPSKQHTSTSTIPSTAPKLLYEQPKNNSSLSSLIDESIRKRRRIERELARNKAAATTMTQNSPRPQTPTADSRASSVAPGTGTSPKPIKVAAAKYAPWDRNDFLQRLETFRSVSSWSTKPERINEVAWAKRGWVCMQNGKNRVRCASHCGGELVVKVDFDGFEVVGVDEDEEDEDIDAEATQGEEDKLEALVSKYEELIVTGHEEGCLWRKRGCDSFYARYRSLHNLSDDQNVINLTKPDEVDISALNLPHDIIEDQPKKNAMIMALFGWAKDDNESSVEMVKCDACFRRLGLWLFVKRPGSAEEEGDEFSSMYRLNVVDEHRDYCPWVNAASQTGEHAGWEILLRILKSSIPGNLVAAPSPARPKTANVIPHKTEEEHRKDDENRWKRLKSLRKSYGSSFAMSILGGKKGEKPAGGTPSPSASPAKGAVAS